MSHYFTHDTGEHTNYGSRRSQVFKQKTLNGTDEEMQWGLMAAEQRQREEMLKNAPMIEARMFNKKSVKQINFTPIDWSRFTGCPVKPGI